MATKKDPNHDLAQRRHVLRLRIHGDERKLAVAYPEDATKLRADLERERAMLAEMDEQLAQADEAVCKEYRDTVEQLFALRDTLLKLRGHFRDEGFRDTIFTRPYLSAGANTSSGIGGVNPALLEPQDTTQVKAALLRVAEMEPAPLPEISASQQLHDERLRNERAGLGHWTDEELQRKAEDPLAFEHGRGAHVLRKGR